jgi:hypothetical protein
VLLKTVAVQPLSPIFEQIKHHVNQTLTGKGQNILTEEEWADIFQKMATPPSEPTTPVKQPAPPSAQPLFSPKKWRNDHYAAKGTVPGKTIKDRTYEFLKQLVEQKSKGNSTTYDVLMSQKDDLKPQLKDDLMTAEKDGDHEYLERHFVTEIIERDVALAQKRGYYPRKKGWLAIQEDLRSPTQSILFKGYGAERNRINGGHRFAVYDTGANELLGSVPGKKHTCNHEFHTKLDEAFTNSHTRKGFIRRARQVALDFIHPGDEPLVPIAPRHLLFGKTLYTDNPEHLGEVQERLRVGYGYREGMFSRWEEELGSGSESEGERGER